MALEEKSLATPDLLFDACKIGDFKIGGGHVY